MKVRINFLNGSHKIFENASISFMTDDKNTIIVCIDSEKAFERFLISTISSFEFSTEKPHLAVTSVLIFGK